MSEEEAFGNLYAECLVIKEREFPLIVDVELTNFCNLHCKHCPTGQGTSIRQKGFMSDFTWYAILRELIESKSAVRFVGWGEPTLHRMFQIWAKLSQHFGLLTHITTNGETLELWNQRPTGFDSIKISDHKHWDLSKPPDNYLPCPKVHSMLTVQWNGDVTACQGDYDGVMVLGNIHKNSLAFFWKCDIMQNYRKMLSEMRHSELALCKNCARKEGK